MKKKQMLKRFMAMLLAAILCISACPGNVAYATEDTGTDVTEDTTGDTGDAGESTGDEIIPNDETGIPDAALYEQLVSEVEIEAGEEQYIDVVKDGKLSVAEAEQIIWLDIYLPDEGNSRVQSFKNLATYVPNLSSLVYYDYLEGDTTILTTEDIDEFAKLENFYSMTLSKVRIENPEDLVKLDQLYGIDISRSNLTNLDFVSAKNFPNCKSIVVYENPIEKLPDAISEMVNLTQLDVSSCKLKEIPDLSKLTNMQYLDIGYNELKTFPDLTGMNNLQKNASSFYGNLFSEEDVRGKLPAHIKADAEFETYIKDIMDDQTKKIECELTADKTKAASGEVITLTLTLRNKGVALSNVSVETLGGGQYFFPEEEYIQKENAICIESLSLGAEVVYTYKVNVDDVAAYANPNISFQAHAEAEDGTSGIWAIGNSDEIEIEKSENEDSGNTGDTGDTGNSGTEEAEPLDITVKEVTVSNKTVVVTDAEPIAQVNVSVAVEGDDVANIPSGNYIFMYFTADDKNEFLGQLYYNAETKAYEGIIPFAGNAYTEGQYKITKFSMYTGTSPYRQDLAYAGDSTFVTYTNNTTDQVSPVLEGVQVYVNGVAQTGTTFTLKKGDTISVRADVTEESQLSGQILLYPDLNAIETAKLMEMMNAGTLRINMYATEYDLEGEKIMNDPFYEGEYHIYYVFIQDRCYNSNHYYEDSLASLYKEVAPNPSNVGLVESETTSEALKKLETNIADVISKEGAVNETTKTKVENALKNGETISVSLQVTNVPENSVDADKKADIQKKADDVFGENTKLVYMDITMNLFSSGSADTLGELKELEEKVTITVNLPEELKGDYNYKVIRSHEKADGTIEVEVLDAVKNEDGTISFETDRFSTYAIAYSTNEANNSTDDSNNNDSTDDSNNNGSNDDSDDNDSSDDSNNNDSSNDSDNGDSNNNGSNGGSNNNGSTNNGTTNNAPTTDNTAVNAVSPTTGDNSMMGFYMVVIAALIVAVVVSKKMHKVS